jgi:hypothetical protein
VAVTAAQFIRNYPEFADAPLNIVTQYLADAYSMTPVGVWGANTDQGAQLRCAQALALSPYARKMALANEEGKTVYDARLTILVRIAASGGSVALGGPTGWSSRP